MSHEVKGVTVSRSQFRSDGPGLSWGVREPYSLSVIVNHPVLGRLLFNFGERAVTGLWTDGEWARVVRADPLILPAGPAP